MFSPLPFLLLPLLGLVVEATNYPRALHEKRTGTIKYRQHRRLSPRDIVPVQIGLKQSNLHRIEELLYGVSDPVSPNYGKHYQPHEVVELFAPSNDTVDTVKAWLEEHGIGEDRVELSQSRGWLKFPATVSEIESLLDTTYHIYEHQDGSEHVGCEEYSLPMHIKEHIEIVHPTVNMGGKRKIYNHSKKRSLNKGSLLRGPKTDGKKPSQLFNDTANCDSQITPDCLRALYDITPKNQPVAFPTNTFAVLELTPQSYVQEDLTNFFEIFAPDIPSQTPELISIDGGTVTADTLTSFDINGESDLDFEYAMTLTSPQKVLLYQAGDEVQGASFNNMLDALDKSFCTFEGGDDPNDDGIYPDPAPGGFKGKESCGIVKPANVISISYGADEVEFTDFYQIRECQEHAKLGMMGVTVLYASGDNGVAGNGGVCIEKFPNGTVIESTSGKTFNPSFPEGCPFVTGVGATQVDPGKTVDDPEGAAEQVIFSGGGFSNVFAIPDYQKSQVAHYFAAHKPPYGADIYNNSQTTRGYPDVAANGVNYVIAIDGEFALVFGTSASTPVFASIITLINSARLAVHKSPVGFINPAIYSANFKQAFNDIKHGNNPGCGTNGFTAVEGWDPVTGLGTPHFPTLVGQFLLLP
ncbi:subtilisin-like protein [Sistotremastrum suecicum HHB10207 ss-3]|uniref:tripeptidyl-peptidase II n=1 Tax=Sistotremastrum suecicum HHB10207 ss-3 TaxID=1314776 RepID=A0A166IZQ6_9AGAM|nr:subtilisin-like protein [Sistotremastrum suecicum HHB10207 ss-3]